VANGQYVADIQGVSRGKLSILRGYSIVHPKQKKKNVYVHMSYSERFPVPKLLIKKEILRTVSNIGIQCSNDQVGTVYLV
jgi:predicted transport protein